MVSWVFIVLLLEDNMTILDDKVTREKKRKQFLNILMSPNSLYNTICRSKNFSTGEKGIWKCLLMDISSVNVDIFWTLQHVHRKGQSLLILLHTNTMIFYDPVAQERSDFFRRPFLGRFTRRGGK